MDWDAFLPPLAGSFAGVVFAFAINYIAHRIKDLRDKDYYKNVIRGEIEKCISILMKQPTCSEAIDSIQAGLPERNGSVRDGMIIPWPVSRFSLLPIDCWISARNSGALRLFKVDEIDRLTRTYSEIGKYNFGVDAVRSAERDVKIHPYVERFMNAFSDLVDHLYYNGKDLLKELKELDTAMWLNKNWWQFWRRG